MTDLFEIQKRVEAARKAVNDAAEKDGHRDVVRFIRERKELLVQLNVAKAIRDIAMNPPIHV